MHQRYSEEALTQPNAPKFTAADFSAHQLIDGLLTDYVVRMGVDARFLTPATMAAPTQMYLFTVDEMKRFGITWSDLQYVDWSLEAYEDGLIAESKTRNGEYTATLFCRKDLAVRLRISAPICEGAEEYLRQLVSDKQKVTASLFGETIPPKSVFSRLEHGRLILELGLPHWLSANDNNWLPDGKTPAWYLHDLQFPKNMLNMAYDPTSDRWKSLPPEERQLRRQFFEDNYRASFGVAPAYTADSNPVILGRDNQGETPAAIRMRKALGMG